ncbi:MAG TPA: RHS repeat-associated core domain-containing protein [Candidatus Kapabacteria bacterium]|nr:RHS repeat-associated core domain-containing protein [Candidatus Kapabacteria bacterium]
MAHPKYNNFHLGSKAVEVDSVGNIIDYVQYNPFGDHTSTSLSAGGVRKYDYEIGRFTSVDPLWEKYTGWTGYQYSLNNPIWVKDWDGKDAGVLVIPAYVGGSVVIGLIGWAYTEATNPGSTQGLVDVISTSFNNAINDILNLNSSNVIVPELRFFVKPYYWKNYFFTIHNLLN